MFLKVFEDSFWKKRLLPNNLSLKNPVRLVSKEEKKDHSSFTSGGMEAIFKSVRKCSHY